MVTTVSMHPTKERDMQVIHHDYVELLVWLPGNKTANITLTHLNCHLLTMLYRIFFEGLWSSTRVPLQHFKEVVKQSDCRL